MLVEILCSMNKLLLILSLFALVSCSDDEPIFIPACIDQEIPIFGQAACPGSGDLSIWAFDGQDVFCFNEGTCYSDSQAFIYDANCNLLCILGGFSGNSLCLGLDWSRNAEYLEQVYVY